MFALLSSFVSFEDIMVAYVALVSVSLSKIRAVSFFFTHCRKLKMTTLLRPAVIFEGWNFNSGNYLFPTDTK